MHSPRSQTAFPRRTRPGPGRWYGWRSGPMAFIPEPETAWSLALTPTGDCGFLSEEAGIQLTSVAYI